MAQVKVVDVRKLIPMQRHRLIFGTYEKLKPGEAFLLINDHDPRPLHHRFEAEHEGEFFWNYVQQGPGIWQVEIGRRETG